MKKFVSLFLALVIILGLLPTSTLAANSEEEALGKVDIFSGGTELSYLSINGRVRTMIYTYYNFKGSGGIKEIPAYCVNPNTAGVPQTVAPGESIQYLAQEKASDPKAMGIVANGYPTRGLGELKLENKYQAYYATKMALWCYLLPSWDINNLKVNSNLTGVELERAQKILAAAKQIYVRGTSWTEILAPEVTCTPDRDTAYPVTVDGKAYRQQVFTFWSKTWVCDYAVSVSFTNPDDAPAGTRIVDMSNKDITTITTSGTGNGYAGKFKVLYPAESVSGDSGSVQLSFGTSVYKYAVFYAICQETDKYGNLQNYLVDTDPTLAMRLSAYSNFSEEPNQEPPDTGLKIIKLETGSDLPLSGALFEVVGPDGATIGTFASGSNGEILLPLTLSGVYTVIERQPPAHHLLPDNVVQHVNVEYGKVATVTFYNAPYGTIRIEKVSNTGMRLPGAVITIQHIESGKTYTAETNFAGVAIFDQLKPGAYRIQETSAPSGWQKDDTIHTTTVTAGETTVFPLVNKELPGLRIIKYDRKNMAALPNVTFEVFRDGVSLGKFRTDEFGEILLSNATPGTYLAYEVDTGSDGHILDTTPQQVELVAGDGIKELMFFNDVKPGLRLVKVDATDPSKVIPNAVFEIKSVAGDYGPKEFTTDEHGEIDVSKLPAGAYVVTEKSCPGYVIDQAQRIIQLDPNEDAQFVFTNSIRPSLQLIKTSADGSRLAGVTFRIAKIADGSHYLDRTTNAQGEILIGDLEPGVYSVKETATVADHIIDPAEHHVELFPGRTSTIVLKNDVRPNLTVHKNDTDTGAPVPGTVFEIRAADGHSVDEIKIGADGSATLGNLMPGVYQITEKSVPAPYLLDAPSQLVTLYPNRDHSIYFENHKKPTLTVNKLDSVTGDPIKGAKFQVWYASNNTDTGELNDLGYFYSNENGQFTIDALRDGWYKITELEPASSYAIKEPATQTVYVKGGESKVVTFENTPLSALVVWKFDSVTGEAIAGAVFQLKYLSGTSGTGGTIIGTYKTSHNGSFTVTGLKAGTYIIEELASDSGHVIDTAPQTAFISGKEQDVVQLYFGNSPKGALLIKKIDSVTHKPLSNVEFLVTTSDGTVVGNTNGKYVTDSAGSILIENIAPGTTLVVKETRAKDGYLLDATPQTIKIKAGETVTLEFRNQPKGNLIIHKLDSQSRKPLEGVLFKITFANGSFVDAEGGKLSTNGLYRTDINGQIVLSGLTGTLVVTEVKTIPGYTIDEKGRSQTVVVNPDDTQSLYFYNTPVGGLKILKLDESTRAPIQGVTYEVRKMNGELVGTYRTDVSGIITLPGIGSGWYTVLEKKAADGYQLDPEPHNIEVKDGNTAVLELTNRKQSNIVIRKVDSMTGDGLYGATFVLYDSNDNPVGEYRSDQRGYVYIDGIPDGRYKLGEIDPPEGYLRDDGYKTVYVRYGGSSEIRWENTAVTGQIQITKYAAEDNAITGTTAGSTLPGAVFEIVRQRSGVVVGYLTTDARGVAASKPLPLGRYLIREVTAPAYYQLSVETFDVDLEYPGQIIKLAAYNKSALTGVSITKTGVKEVLAGSNMSYTFTVANTSNVPLENFYWHDRIPTDATTVFSLTTGTYSQRLNYRILYKTNSNDYRVLASNLLTTNNYGFMLNALPLMQGEVVTDVYFDFGTVPAGFQSVIKPTLTVAVSPKVASGYQIINRADVGGKYQGVWETKNASWGTIAKKLNPPSKPQLPKTGY